MNVLPGKNLLVHRKRSFFFFFKLQDKNVGVKMKIGVDAEKFKGRKSKPMDYYHSKTIDCSNCRKSSTEAPQE